MNLIHQEYQVHQGLLDLHHQIMIHQLELDWRQELQSLFHHQPSFEGIVAYQLIDLFKCYQFIFFVSNSLEFLKNIHIFITYIHNLAFIAASSSFCFCDLSASNSASNFSFHCKNDSTVTLVPINFFWAASSSSCFRFSSASSLRLSISSTRSFS